jgi:hypothetical protein
MGLTQLSFPYHPQSIRSGILRVSLRLLVLSFVALSVKRVVVRLTMVVLTFFCFFRTHVRTMDANTIVQGGVLQYSNVQE